jgi:PAS domain S-box-containing protein
VKGEPKIGIRRKIITLVFTVTLTVIAIGIGLGYYAATNLMRKSAEEAFKESSTQLAETMSKIVSEEIEDIKIYSDRSLWEDDLVEANEKYKTINPEDIKRAFLEKDKIWKENSSESPLVKKTQESRSGEKLKSIARNDNAVEEIFITDKKGGLVAASNKTSDFYQADERWWQEAYSEGEGKIFVEDLEYDESAGTLGMSISVPIYGEEKEVIGVCKAIVNVDRFLTMLKKFKRGETGSATLIGKDGYIVYHHDMEPYTIKIHDEKFLKLSDGIKKSDDIKEELFGAKKNIIIVGAEVRNPFLLKEGISWKIFVGQSEKDVFAAVNRLIIQGILLTPILIIVMVILALVFSKKLVAPIQKLRDATERIGKGDFSKIIEIKTGDEIEQFSDAFNKMVSEIKHNQKESREAKEYSENIVSSMHDALLVIDIDGALETVNEYTEELLGYTEKELIGEHMEMFCDDEAFREENFSKLIQEGRSRQFDTICKTKEGESIPVNFSLSLMIDDEGALKGVVCVARDMRQKLSMISELEESKKELEGFSKTLEDKVKERTDELQQSQEAALNIMEDMQEAKSEIEKTNEELSVAKTEIESFSKGLEEKVKERTAELTTLSEISSAIAYTSDYQELMKLIMESLLKIVDYDVCAALLFDENTANITVKSAYSEGDDFVTQVKDGLIYSTSLSTEENISDKDTSVSIIPSDPDAEPEEDRKFDILRSSFNAPFSVGGNVIGMMNVSSCKDEAFGEEDIKIIHTMANQVSNAIHHLRLLATAEKTKMESIVESMVDGVIMLDERNNPVILNPRARTLLGLNADAEVSGKEFRDILKKLSLDKELAETLKAKKVTTKEVVDEDERTLYCNITPVKDVDKNIIGTMIILRDISERKKLRTQFQYAQKMESFGMLAGGIAHDFNNLLTGIMGNVDAVLMDVPKDSKTYQYVKDIESAGDRATGLCRQMLAYSGGSEIETTIFSLSDVLNDMAQLMSASISKKIEIRKEFAAEIPNIEADITQIRQIIMNLIINAAEIIGDKTGVITISTGVAECDEHCFDDDSFSGKPKAGTYVYYKITDTGGGMSDDTIKKVFDPFFSTKFTGRGLGLAAVLGIVNSHKGSIRIKSEIGKGTTFTCLFPMSTKKVAIQHGDEDGDDLKDWKGSGTILLIDDEILARTVGKRLLEKAGFDVLVASDGPQGIDIFRENKDEISAVLLDFVMPKMNGEEVFHELSDIEKDVKVIICSGYNEQEAVSNLKAVGLAGFIQKPYRNKELMTKLRALLT